MLGKPGDPDRNSPARMNPQLLSSNLQPLSPMGAVQWWHACGDLSVRIETNRDFKGLGGPAVS